MKTHESLGTAEGACNTEQLLWKTTQQFHKKLNIPLHHDLIILFFCCLHKRNKSMFSYKILYMSVHCSSVCKRAKLETIQVFISWGQVNKLWYSHTAAAESLQSCPTVRPQRWQPTRLPRPWDSPGKSTGVGCHCLLRQSHNG